MLETMHTYYYPDIAVSDYRVFIHALRYEYEDSSGFAYSNQPTGYVEIPQLFGERWEVIHDMLRGKDTYQGAPLIGVQLVEDERCISEVILRFEDGISDRWVRRM